jgi:basic membrane protein A
MPPAVRSTSSPRSPRAPSTAAARALAIGALTLAACTDKAAKPAAPAAAPSATATSTAGARLQIGIVLDIGGVDDKSFNESAYRGLKRAERELGVTGAYYQPSQPADRKTGLRQYASKGYDLVVGVGFIFTDEIIELARDFPAVKFACVDMSERPAAELPPNLVALTFREEQGSFLAGALAASVAQSGKVGFIGGMNVPLIHKFEAGYVAGAKAVRPDVQVLVNYAGETPKAFQDPETGKNRAFEQYKAGADVIYHAAGKTGLGVFQAAKELDKQAIGVDSDQRAEAPGHVLTSMVKAVDVAVFDTIAAVKAGTFKPGVRSLGLAERGVSLAYDPSAPGAITPEAWARVEALRQEIVDGRRVVPATREAQPAR